MNKVDAVNCAREYLLTNGWTQGSFRNDSGNVCLMGAFTRSLGMKLTEVGYDELLSDISSLTDGWGAIGWNDTPGRTFNEVMELMDKLAIKAKEETPTPIPICGVCGEDH